MANTHLGVSNRRSVDRATWRRFPGMSDICRVDYVCQCRISCCNEVGSTEKKRNRMEMDCEGLNQYSRC